MELKLPPWSVFYPDLRLLVCRPRGIVDEALLEKTMNLLEAAEREATEPFNRYIDLSQIDAVICDGNSFSRTGSAVARPGRTSHR